jgi:hypothetical protein
MSVITVFDDSWYAEMIARFQPNTGQKNAATDAHATAILAGFCILSQSIDNLAKALKSITPEHE